MVDGFSPGRKGQVHVLVIDGVANHARMPSLGGTGRRARRSSQLDTVQAGRTSTPRLAELVAISCTNGDVGCTADDVSEELIVSPA